MTVVQLTTDNREPFRQYHRVQPWFGAAPAALLQGFAERSDIKVHVVSCTQRPMASSPAKLASNIWFHSLHVPKIGWLRSGYQGCIRAARSKIRELRPDIVHGQGTERDCALSACLSGFPNVVTMHGNMSALSRLFQARVGTFYWVAARLEDFTLRRTRGVLCNSAYTEALVQSRTSLTWRVPNALRRQFFERRTPRARSIPVTILNVGVISSRKRQCELLDCARRLHDRGVKVTWDFCGQADPSTEYAARFLSEVEEAKPTGFAHYLGTRSDDEIVPLYDESSALVHFPTEEAFGLVVAEALARNLKFFGSNVGGIADIATGIEGAELFPPNDWNALESAIVRWVAGGFLMPSTASDQMKARYAPEVIAEQHLKIYREILGKKSQPPNP
jgi:glycosyltransferase involved in cell wall biosynthesis